MERRNRSHLVQFWLTVEGFKDPLEALGQNLALDNVIEGGSSRPSANDATIGDDIAFLYSAYFADGRHRLDIPARLIGVIAELGQNPHRPFSASDTRRAKLAVYQAQRAVYELMEEEDWSAFQKSDLYFKAVADLKQSSPQHRLIRANSSSTPSMSSSSARLSPSGQVRRVSDGPPILTPSPTASPLLPRRPLLVNGSFMPAPVSPAATPVMSNDFDTSMRDAGSDVSGRASPHASTILTPATKRLSAQFDVLFGTQDDGASERDPLFADADEEDEETAMERERIAAIQAALEEIIDSDPMANSLTLEREPEPEPDPEPEPQTQGSPRSTLHPLAGRKLTSRSAEDLPSVRDVSPARPVTRYSPGSRRPKLVRRGSDEGLHQRKKSIFAEDDEDDAEGQGSGASDQEADHEAFPLPVPGNLHLRPEITRLTAKIAELAEQERLLDSLIRQADLTGNARELRLLRRSLASLQREHRTASFQKEQYERHEAANRLVPGRTHVTLPTTVQGVDESTGRPVIKYVVEVSQVVDGRKQLSWTVTHRYSEFYALDRALRDWIAETRDPRVADAARALVDMPGKRLVPSTSAGFVESRRLGLERYMQSLLSSAVFCASPLVQNFLSRGTPAAPAPSAHLLAPRNLVRTLYKTVASTIDVDLAPSMLDMVSQSLTRQLSEVAGGLGVVTEEVAGLMPFASDDDSSNFTGPICDAFLELFDLKERDWLRRQAIVLLLQQVLGSTVERKVRDLVGKASQPKKIEKLLAAFQENMWPGGERKPPAAKRTPDEIRETRLSASRKLGRLLPDVLANVVGRSNARKAAQRTFAVIQDQRLNQYLWVRVLDEVLYALFPVGVGEATSPHR